MTECQSLGMLFWVVVAARRPRTLAWPTSFPPRLKKDETGSLQDAGCIGLPGSWSTKARLAACPTGVALFRRR